MCLTLVSPQFLSDRWCCPSTSADRAPSQRNVTCRSLWWSAFGSPHRIWAALSMPASPRVPAWRWLLLSRLRKLFGAGLHSPATVLPEENNSFCKNAATVMSLFVEIYPQTLHIKLFCIPCVSSPVQQVAEYHVQKSAWVSVECWCLKCLLDRRGPRVTSAAYPQSVQTPETHTHTDLCYSAHAGALCAAHVPALNYPVHTVNTITHTNWAPTPAAEGQTYLSIIPQMSLW